MSDSSKVRRAPLIDLHAGRGGGGRQAVWFRRVFISAVFFFFIRILKICLEKFIGAAVIRINFFHDLLQKLGLEVNPA